MKKGITLSALLVTIAIILIFAATVTVSGYNVLNDSKKIKFATEVSYITEAVDSYYNINKSLPIGESVNVELSQISKKAISQFENEEGDTDKKIILYQVDKGKLGIKDTIYGNGNINNKDIYALSKETNKIYYLKGVNIGNMTYYTLTEDLKELVNYNETKIVRNTDEDEDSENDIVESTITIGDKKSLISSDEKYYYTLVTINDKENVKSIKFEREIFDENNALIYFKSNGIELQEDIIEVKEDTKGVTVYVEYNTGSVMIETKEF